MISGVQFLIPAAGSSARFRAEGYTTPKPFLEIDCPERGCDYMINHVIETIPARHDQILIAIPKESSKFQCTIPRGVGVIEIKKTEGQADTIYQMLELLRPEHQVVILDCDMVLTTEDVRMMAEFTDLYGATVAVTKSFDPNASRIDKVPYPEKFAEKELISEWAIVGARAFSCAWNLKSVIEEYDRIRPKDQEPYLTPALNLMGGKKFAHQITDFLDWGTPARIRESGAKIVR